MMRRKRMRGGDYLLCAMIALFVGIMSLVRAIEYNDPINWVGFLLSIPVVIFFGYKCYQYYN